jgi:hypothetical protein
MAPSSVKAEISLKTGTVFEDSLGPDDIEAIVETEGLIGSVGVAF